LSNTCHVIFEYTTGDACGQNMTTRNTYLLHSEYVLRRFHDDTGITPAQFFLEANMGGDKKVSELYHIAGGHGRSVLASVTLPAEVVEGVLKSTVDDLLKLREVASEGGAMSGMIGVAANPVNVIAAIYAATGQDLACAGTSSMAMSSATECPAGLLCTLRLPNLEVGTVGGGTGLPHQSRYLDIMGCRDDGGGGANRFAQVVAAATLCLELSTTAAMAAAGSISFYTAHLTRGGMKRTPTPARVAAGVANELGGEG
jgi:hydroxymethylglutaryl-CoA reductase (NADPH)